MEIKFRFVCATRVTGDEFLVKTALGRSLSLYQAPFIELFLFERNTRGLPCVYNEALRRSADDPAVLIFVHDDVLLCDFYWPKHLLQALRSFDIVGLAGNTRRLPRQPAWCFVDTAFTPDDASHLSGCVAHGSGFPDTRISRFGAPEREVKLLDGLFLAVRSETLSTHDLWFDERFDFHFYDLDFCRGAETRGLRMGTCTLSAIHESGGAYGTPAWHEGYQRYLDKWRE